MKKTKLDTYDIEYAIKTAREEFKRELQSLGDIAIMGDLPLFHGLGVRDTLTNLCKLYDLQQYYDEALQNFRKRNEGKEEENK